MRKWENVVLFALAVLGASVGSVCSEIYDPDNYDSLGSLIAEDTTVIINTGTAGNSNSVPIITVNGQTFYGLWDVQTAVLDSETFAAHSAIFCFSEIDVGTNVNINVSGGRALVLLAKGNISLRSNLHIGSAGASDFGVGNTDRQGTGGGYGGPGCWVYSSNSGWLVAGGRSYGDETLSSVLLGGSRGGDGNAGNVPGQGGGALALVSKYSMLIDATINANGYLTPTWLRGGGSGSGGAVLLHSHQLDFGSNGVVVVLGMWVH